MIKKWRRKLKYLGNEKNFQDEIKHYDFIGLLLKQIKQFLEGECPTFKFFYTIWEVLSYNQAFYW